MNCPNCQNDLWIEEKAVRLAAMPSADPRLMSVPREAVYRLRCAECDFLYGTEPKPKNNVKQEDESGRGHRHTTGKQ